MDQARQRALYAARILIWVLVGWGLVLLARKLDWDEVFGAFSRADLKLAVLATALGPLAIACQGLRWSQLLRALRRVPHGVAVCAMAAGQAASAFLPMRAGEAIRTELCSRSTGLSRASIVGTVALDAVVNSLVMFALAGTLPLLLPVPRWMALIFWGGMALMLVVLGILLRLARHPETIHNGRVQALIARLRGGLIALRDPAHVLPALGFALLGWMVEIVIAVLALSAFGLPHDVPHAMAVLFGVNLALAIPAPPGALGTFELGAGMALVAFGGDKERAAAFAIGYHAIQLLPQLILGGLLVTRFRRPRRRATDLQPAEA
jgi:glycosyltransferase 2 family protein